jgi:hypothetical protein
MGEIRRAERRPERASTRPTWWILLAVSMAVMALIFALSDGTNPKSTPAKESSLLNPPIFVNRSTASAKRTPELNQLSPIPSQPLSSRAAGTPTLPGSGVSARPSSSTPPSTAVTTGTPGTTYTYPGYLSYPYNVASSYPVAGAAGSVTASAAWQANATLDVSISCPSGQRSSVGTSTVSVSMATTISPCSVRLSEQPAVLEAVAYDLTITIGPNS